MLNCNRYSLAMQKQIIRCCVLLSSSIKVAEFQGGWDIFCQEGWGARGQLSFFASLMAINAYLHDIVTEGKGLCHCSTESSLIAIWSQVGMIIFIFSYLGLYCFSLMRQNERIHSWSKINRARQLLLNIFNYTWVFFSSKICSVRHLADPNHCPDELSWRKTNRKLQC